jgi:hypothetical protein
VTTRDAWVFFVSFYVLGVMLVLNTITSYLIEFYEVREPLPVASARALQR